MTHYILELAIGIFVAYGLGCLIGSALRGMTAR